MNAVPPPSELKPHKLTVEELLSFADSGAFEGLPRIELLDGVLYEMSPQRSAHVVAKNEIGYRLRRALEELGSPLVTLIEPTITIDANTAAEPDIGVMTQRRVEEFYPAGLVQLAIEIASTTLRTDMGYKREIYARAGLPEYWVVDLQARWVHQFAHPQEGRYSESRVVKVGDEISSASISGLAISTDDLI